MSDTMTQVNGKNIILSSDGMHEMAENIGKLLALRTDSFSCMRAECDVFADGEQMPWIPATVRGTHVFLMHDLRNPDPDKALMRMFFTGDALMRASVTGITLVVSFIPYLRQDRKNKPRVPISARFLADLIQVNKKIERVITFDMHSDQEQGFFSIPVDNIPGMVVHAAHYRERFGGDFSNLAFVAPDVGAGVRTTRFARMLSDDVPVYIIEKKRSGPNKIESLRYIGPPLDGMDVILVDDMIDTGTTIRMAADEIMRNGARSVEICVTHAIFSKNAETKFVEAGYNVLALPTIPRSKEYRQSNASWLTYLSMDELLANVIYEASLAGGSVSKLSN